MVTFLTTASYTLALQLMDPCDHWEFGEPMQKLFSTCIVTASCALLGACGGGGGADPRPPLSSSLAGLTTSTPMNAGLNFQTVSVECDVTLTIAGSASTTTLFLPVTANCTSTDAYLVLWYAGATNTIPTQSLKTIARTALSLNLPVGLSSLNYEVYAGANSVTGVASLP